ncbi:MAG: vitamin K epoxide reductase family protein [Terriglobales bacterium]
MTTAIAAAVPVRRTTGALGWAIFLLAAAGLVLSALSLVAHYRTDDTAYCDVSETFNCDLVNRSIYSEIGPVPVAGIGVVGYALLMVLSRLAANRRLAVIMLLGALGGLAFALYLTYIEAYVLFAWCILCLGSQAAIALITILAAWHAKRVWSVG